jgi:hypothetical protein
MMRENLRARMSFLNAITYLSVSALSVFGQSVNAQDVIKSLPLNCKSKPNDAAVAFFSLVESPGGEDAIRSEASTLFSKRLLAQESPDTIADFVNLTKKSFEINTEERPLSDRLTVYPESAPIQSGDNQYSRDVAVKLVALSPRGKLDQRVTLTCEEGVWKVVGFSYGPPGR